MDLIGILSTYYLLIMFIDFGGFVQKYLFTRKEFRCGVSDVKIN